MNTYENAVPKPLKFLISGGKMIDEDGNVIAESETLEDLYTKWNPEVKKYLLSDGSVVDENNNLIVKNDYYKKIYEQADPKIAKYLHANGTIDENSGSGGANLDENVAETIDVSQYTEPVEILPSSGKDGMKKATITLTNISSASVTMACYMITVDGNSTRFYVRADLLESLNDGDVCTSGELFIFNDDKFNQKIELSSSMNISKNGTTYYFNLEGNSVEMVHVNSDFTIS